MGKKSTYPTLAGQHAPNHEPGGADVAAGVVPGAHVLATTGPHTNTLPLTDLEVGVQGEVIVRGAADWEALGVGAAGEALLSGGVGVTPSWGAPATAAHVLATTGPHTNTLPLTDLEVGAQGEIITRTGADWVAFAVGAAGQALLSGGAGADVSWGAPAPAAHEGTHVSGGSDDIDSALDGRAITLTTQGDIVYASGANTLARLGAGVSGQFLKTQGAGSNPIWDDAGLTFTEVYDGDLPGGSFVTPAVDGIFSAFMQTVDMSMQVYSDASGNWTILGDLPGFTDAAIATVFHASYGVVGQASKIRWENTAGGARKTVVNSLG